MYPAQYSYVEDRDGASSHSYLAHTPRARYYDDHDTEDSDRLVRFRPSHMDYRDSALARRSSHYSMDLVRKTLELDNMKPRTKKAARILAAQRHGVSCKSAQWMSHTVRMKLIPIR